MKPEVKSMLDALREFQENYPSEADLKVLEACPKNKPKVEPKSLLSRPESQGN